MHWEPDTSLIEAAREIAPIVRGHSAEAERERRLSQRVLDALRETGLLRMNTPRSLGGLETDPVTRALVVEEIGRHVTIPRARRAGGRVAQEESRRVPPKGARPRCSWPAGSRGRRASSV